MAYTNPCGGLRWDMQGDGLIAVEGEGTPAFEPGSLQFKYLEQSWANWGGDILSASSAHGVPASWVLAIMCMETGLWSKNPEEQAGKVSYAGAVGLMQVMPAEGAKLGYSAQDLLDPAKNIDAGARFLAKVSGIRNGQLPEVAAIYNSGRVCGPATSSDCRASNANEWNLCSASNYPRQIIQWNNAAIMYLDMSPRRGKMLAGLAIGAAGLYAAAVIAGFAMMPRWLKR
jgi:hypothetical protein